MSSVLAVQQNTALKGTAASGSYIPALDGLRACAVLLVVAFHTRLLRGGFVGVDVFFVLSAFLITRILLKQLADNGRIRIGQFYKRRFLRLAPALLLMLFAYLLLAPLVWPSKPHLGDALFAATYVSNYTFAFFGRPEQLSHTWSLAVEEQFYLLWPLLLPFLLRSSRPVYMLALAYAAILLWRASFEGDWQSYYYRADTRCTGLIAGAALALIVDKQEFMRRHAWMGAILIIIASLLGRFGPGAAAVFPLAEVGALLLIGAAARGQLGNLTPVLCAPPAILLGKLSYGIYLWHFPIAYALRPHIGGLTLFLLVLVPSVILAWISFVTVERLPALLNRKPGSPKPTVDQASLPTTI